MNPDAFRQVAEALRGLWRSDRDAWTDRDGQARVRNLLLDACGSDHRALVELVLVTGDELRASLVGARASSTGSARDNTAAEPIADPRTWETQRAPYVHRLVATRFLQTDIARWLVDTWAFALGVTAYVPMSPVHETASVAQATAQGSHLLSTASGLMGRTGRSGAPGAQGTGARGLAMPSARTVAPLAATGTTGGAPLSRSRLTAADLARIKRMERVGFILLGSAGVFAMLAHGYAMWLRPLDRQRMVAASKVESSTAVSTVASGVLATSATTSGPTVSGLSEAVSDDGSHGGRYRISHRATSVTGGDGCEVVEGALARQQTTVETFEHDVGTSTLRLASRQLRGAVQPDGAFQLGPDSGTTDGVRWTFVMRGRFTADGFVAHSQKTTEAIMKWHDTRSCAVVAELVGTRVVP